MAKIVKQIKDFYLGKYKIQNLTREKNDSLKNPERYIFKGQINDNNFKILANHFGDLIEEFKELYPEWEK